MLLSEEKRSTSAGSRHAATNNNPPRSDVPLRFSSVRVVFCFRDSARARAPSSPMLLSEQKRSTSAGSRHAATNNNPPDVLQRFSSVRVVFCFRDSARARAPSSPMLLPEQKRARQLDLVTQLQTIIHPDLTYLKIQLGEGRVLLQRLGQSAGSLVADAII